LLDVGLLLAIAKQTLLDFFWVFEDGFRLGYFSTSILVLRGILNILLDILLVVASDQRPGLSHPLLHAELSLIFNVEQNCVCFFHANRLETLN
jgi:hypothetical protein